MHDFLRRVCDEARDRVDAARRVHPVESLRDTAAARVPAPSFAGGLAAPGVGVIAEIKRASPSRGPLAPIPDAAETASRYAGGGAAAISVLTEPDHFRGSLDDLDAVTARVDVPVLRKDFLVDAYQVAEAAAFGAAAVLLITAALGDEELAGLLTATWEAGLDALVEVTRVDEAQRAATAHRDAGGAGQLILGINARDLRTLAVDPARFADVRPSVPAGALTVAESGIRGADDVARVARLGADAVLVGESVATADDPTAAVGALVAAGRTTAGARP